MGFCVCLTCTALGTALCYLFYNTFGGPLVRRLFLEQARARSHTAWASRKG